MNYQKHYNKLCERAKTRHLDCYTENHHIVPRCMDGTDDPDNIVALTAEEHYVAHQLLVKMYPEHKGLVWAAIKMSGHSKNDKRKTNKYYGWLRQKHIKNLEARKGEIWITDGNNSKIISKNNDIPEGWRKGSHYKPNQDKIFITSETECKMIHKKDKIPDGWIKKHPNKEKICITDGIQDKRISKGSKIPNGWKLGRVQESIKGRVYITNGIKTKMISQNEKIPDGWWRGKTLSPETRLNMSKAAKNRNR